MVRHIFIVLLYICTVAEYTFDSDDFKWKYFTTSSSLVLEESYHLLFIHDTLFFNLMAHSSSGSNPVAGLLNKCKHKIPKKNGSSLVSGPSCLQADNSETAHSEVSHLNLPL